MRLSFRNNRRSGGGGSSGDPSDPARLEAEPTLAEQDRDRLLPKAEEEAMVKFVLSKKNEAQEGRRHLEPGWAVALALHGGTHVNGWQWCYWDEAGGCLGDMRTGRKIRYVTDNQIAPLLLRVRNRAVINKPDASVTPLTDGQIHVDAADEARSVLEHCDREHDLPALLSRAVFHCTVGPLALNKIYWDPTKEALIPTDIDPKTGQATSTDLAPVGDICEEIRPGTSVYLDPRAEDWEQVAYLVDVYVRGLAYVKEKWGKDVDPDTELSEQDSPLTAYLGAGMVGSTPRQWSSGHDNRSGGAGRRPRSVIVYEYWEKPTPKYPKKVDPKTGEVIDPGGRYIVIGGSRVLSHGPLPYKDGELPYVPLVWDIQPGTAYGRVLAEDLAGDQISLNLLKTRRREKMTEEKTFLVVPAIGSAGDAGETSNVWEKIPVEPGQAGQVAFLQSPPISPEWYTEEENCRRAMMDKAGVHEPSQGRVPSGVTAARAIEALQQADAAHSHNLAGNIETWNLRRAKMIISRAEQFYSGPRLMLHDTTPDPVAMEEQAEQGDPMQGMMQAQNDMTMGAPSLPRRGALPDGGGVANLPPSSPPVPPAARRVVHFRAMAEGGKCQVSVTPGSAIPKSPAALNEEILTYYKEGLFGPPGDPRAGEIAVSLMELKDQTGTIKRLRNLTKQMAAQQAQAAQLEAETQANTTLQVERMKIEAMREMKMAEIQMKVGEAEQVAAAKARGDSEKVVIQSGMKREEMADQFVYDLALQDDKQRHEAGMAEEEMALQAEQSEADAALRGAEMTGKQGLEREKLRQQERLTKRQLDHDAQKTDKTLQTQKDVAKMKPRPGSGGTTR